ncbi:unnamed protein product [Phytophthora fragariaefolia]|uniref:Unnamed protein product n=1 Tax=Phytophthora fragariaefolia TaxID=1490495 RepID=A0A9W6Y1A6_9STRA|nr:unnamed protein product [Phytophthora fragariaefolia]
MSCLGGRARSWAYGRRLTDPTCFSTYEVFKQELRQAFEPPQNEFRSRAEFLDLQQGKHDVHAYAQRARYLVSTIVTNPIDEATKVITFMKGLKDGSVKTYLFREYPTKLDFEELKQPRSLLEGRLATGVVVRTEKRAVRAHFSYEEKKFVDELIVLDLDDKFDMVVGMPWLARHDPVIAWAKRTIVRSRSSSATESDGPVGAAASDLSARTQTTERVVKEKCEPNQKTQIRSDLRGSRSVKCDAVVSTVVDTQIEQEKPVTEGSDQSASAPGADAIGPNIKGRPAVRRRGKRGASPPGADAASSADGCKRPAPEMLACSRAARLHDEAIHNQAGLDCARPRVNPAGDQKKDLSTAGPGQKNTRGTGFRTRSKRHKRAKLRKSLSGTETLQAVTAGPPTLASELTSIPAMSWKRFARYLRDGRIDQIRILSGVESMKSEVEELKQLVTEGADALSAKSKKNASTSRAGTHSSRVRSTRSCAKQVKPIDDFFESRRKAGQVRESKSPHRAPTFCVKKVQGGWRIVHAYNKLNDATVPAHTPIPRKDVIIDSMALSTIFSALDLRDEFYHILMRESDIPLMTNGVRPDPGKVGLINEWSTPSNVKKLRQYLGLATYLCKYVSKYAGKIRPLSQHLKKDAAWDWTAERQQIFDAVKQGLTEAPILAVTDQGRPFHVVCDASDFAIGCALMQHDHEGRDRVVYWQSCQLKPAERNYPVHDKEHKYTLAKFRVYLLGIGVVRTSTPSSALLDDVRSAYANDADAKRLLDYFAAPSGKSRQKLAKHHRARVHRYRIHNGLPLYSAVDDNADRVVVPDNHELQLKITYEYHDAPMSVHPGREKTYLLLTRDFYWSHQYKWVLLVGALKSYAHSFHHWSDCLPMAKFAINNSVHVSTGHTPFYVNAMRHPRSNQQEHSVYAGRRHSKQQQAKHTGRALGNKDAELKPELSSKAVDFVQCRQSVIRFVQDAIAASVDRQNLNAENNGRGNTNEFKIGSSVY